ncbi:hypothetical protein V8G54_013207 [Vigna mungo]|uniref:Cycloartenol synthase n=1 Tax=Vigna mungo TaxID=3915 RepID=A0AAQ3NSJ6_VIGMU
MEKTMWKLKFAEGGSPWIRSLNNHVGRQVWEFDPKLGSPQDLLEIEKARQNFHENRFSTKHSSDLLMRLQEGCGVTAGWSICQCPTYMERGLLAQSHQQYYL